MGLVATVARLWGMNRGFSQETTGSLGSFHVHFPGPPVEGRIRAPFLFLLWSILEGGTLPGEKKRKAKGRYRGI